MLLLVNLTTKISRLIIFPDLEADRTLFGISNGVEYHAKGFYQTFNRLKKIDNYKRTDRRSPRFLLSSYFLALESPPSPSPSAPFLCPGQGLYVQPAFITWWEEACKAKIRRHKNGVGSPSNIFRLRNRLLWWAILSPDGQHSFLLMGRHLPDRIPLIFVSYRYQVICGLPDGHQREGVGSFSFQPGQHWDLWANSAK